MSLFLCHLCPVLYERKHGSNQEWVSMAEFEYSHDKHVLGTDWKSRVSAKVLCLTGGSEFNIYYIRIRKIMRIRIRYYRIFC